MFGGSSLFYIPHHFYSDLALPSRRPSLHQLAALSRISNYRLCDWLAVFDFHLDDIPRLQPLLPRKHTVVLDSSVYDENAWRSWFDEKQSTAHVPPITPLGNLLSPGSLKRAKELAQSNSGNFRYARIGEEDLLAFPDLLPGSIVRIDTRRAAELPLDGQANPSRQFFFVERGGRFHCGRLQRTGKDRLILCSSTFPFAQIELSSGAGVNILGAVDAEMRPLGKGPYPCRLPVQEKRSWAPGQRRSAAPAGLKELIRLSRIRTGLSFREAMSLSRKIAADLGDETYFTALGTLSDYETRSQPPRHVQKIISLCILYCIGFWDFLRASALPVDSLDGEPIPYELVPGALPRPDARLSEQETEDDREKLKGGFLRKLIDQLEDVPLFLRDALAALSGLRDLSTRDVFWVGGERNAIHPYLLNATFAVVNRRLKKPVNNAVSTVWEQPLYIILKRDGAFLCGVCTLEDGLLSLHPYPDRPFAFRELRNGVDAEVIGEVVTIVRRLF